ncbi:unnamed protein product, partial [Polarella glacialis]
MTGIGEEVSTLNILAFCGWPERASAAGLSRTWRESLGFRGGQADHCGAGYWRFLCERLAEEHQVYVPLPYDGAPAGVPAVGVAGDWKDLFQELFALSHKDEARATNAARASVDPSLIEKDIEDSEEAFKIGVAARFRPAQSSASVEDEDRVVLPLHQKVQLVRRQLGCSREEAMSVIMRKRQRQLLGGKEPVKEKLPGDIFLPLPRGGSPDADDKENIPVAAASKVPLAEQSSTISEEGTDATDAADAADGRCSILSVHEDKASVLAITKQSGLREFGFDLVFSDRSAQPDVYNLTARRLVMEFLNGTSASIICYGQTGSGKTHTMFGPSVESEAMRGLVPRTCAEVLAAVQGWRERGLEANLGASYVELFGSEVSDLLREGNVVGQGRDGRYTAVRATDRVGHRYVLDGHTECQVQSLREVDELLRAGDQAKRRAATAMNERSTRAHTVFVLALTLQRPSVGGIQLPPRKSRFYFADLGGSEKLSKSKVDAGTKAPVTMVGGEEQSRISWKEFYMHRQRVQESLNINKGLFSLKRVIEALHRRSRLATGGTPAHLLLYVPYQDSKLTMLLQEALGGSARTLIVTTATMDPTHAEESLQTLRFGETCAQVQKRREADQAQSIHAALETIEEDVKKIQAEIARKERWETRLIRRQDVDTVAGAFGEGQTVVRNEVVPTSVLVGAEAEREQLEQLLQRQADLQGLSGAKDFGQDYRMMLGGAADGGKGVDFRHRNRFSVRTKAKDFEDEVVVADALRFFFRRASSAIVTFGETEESAKKRLDGEELPEGYLL